MELKREHDCELDFVLLTRGGLIQLSLLHFKSSNFSENIFLVENFR